ncbi:MAG TPA: hypothetical protein VLA34_03500, partial [Candidatus Krumholzibacterium sp.]|nr:hypothetical protein [Candidatus Krumholzibacterium sp.]
MSQRSLICVISALAIVFMAVPAQASEMERTILPAIGVIINPSGKNIAVRESPPEVSAFSYKLADRICSVGVGTVFEALKELKIVNGEVWYRIHIDRANVKNPIGWDRRDIDGWIAGRFRNRWAVSFLHEDIKQYANSLPDVRQTSSDYRLPVDRESLDSALPVPGGEDRTMLPDITRDTGDEPDSATDGTSAGTEGPAVSTGPGFTEQPSDPGIDSAAVADIAGPQGLKDDDSQGGLSFLLRYILLFAGSCTAVIVLAIERN